MNADYHHSEHEGVHRFLSPVRTLGNLLVDVFHYVGLFAIGAATVWAAGTTFFLLMVEKAHASVEDLLLLFIYLEVGAMVGIYFKTNHMPVRFLIYVAITATTRHMIGVLNHSSPLGLELLVISSAIAVLTIAVLLIRYASHRFPSLHGSQGDPRTDEDHAQHGGRRQV
ncbi:MAG: phosphate-starvation-inducible PsiE family protein [Hyphomicrobiaceae bacterium]